MLTTFGRTMVAHTSSSLTHGPKLNPTASDGSAENAGSLVRRCGRIVWAGGAPEGRSTAEHERTNVFIILY